MRRVGAAEWCGARVSGGVAETPIAHGIMDNPYRRDSEEKVQRFSGDGPAAFEGVMRRKLCDNAGNAAEAGEARDVARLVVRARWRAGQLSFCTWSTTAEKPGEGVITR